MKFGSDGKISGERPDRHYEVDLSVPCEALSDRTRCYYKAAGAGTTVDMACHHVIPWNVIPAFWNCVCELKTGESKTTTNRRYEILRTYLSTFGVPKPQLKDLGKDMQERNFKAREDWGARVCWSPNNLVIGPKSRSDDPGPELDFPLAPADIYGGRVSALRAAGRNMENFTKTGNLDLADRAVQHFSSIRHLRLMEWNEQVWMIAHQSPHYAPSKNHGIPVQPKWRVRNATEY
jgi:hypothetical protein